MDAENDMGFEGVPAPTPPSQQRLDAEWTAVSALREILGIARKGAGGPTYAQTLALAEYLSPELFGREQSMLARHQESSGARQYRQMAEAESEIQERSISPLELVQQEIERYDKLVSTSYDRDLLRKELNTLVRIRRELKPRSYTEQQLILRDVFKVIREPTRTGSGDDYCEFELADHRILRIRILHPDPPEHSMGADVIYEMYWDEKRLVRLTAIQYKIWKGRTIYKTDDLASQLLKLRKAFCGNRLCDSLDDSSRKEAYRLPWCAAFLRPTDKLQDSDSRLISSGYHVPVCVIERLWRETGRGGWKAESKDFRSEAVTHRVFEELFNTNMLGSRWLTYEELEELYQEHGILDSSDRIVICAQEYGAEAMWFHRRQSF